MKNIAFLFILLFSACVIKQKMPDDTRGNVKAIIKDKCYTIEFQDNRNSYIEDFRNNVFIGGSLRFERDSVLFSYGRPGIDVYDKFLIRSYRYSQTSRGHIVIEFSINRPQIMCDKKKDKDTPMTFHLEVVSPQWINIDIDGDRFIGKFRNL